MTLEPRSGRPGTEVLVSGAGFICEPPRGDGRDPVVVQWSGLDSFEKAYPDFDSGRFTAALTVPAEATGTIEATVRCLWDDSGHRQTFTVEPEPDVSTPPSDPVTSDPTIPPTPRPSTPTSPATPSTPNLPPTAPTSSPTPSPSPTPSASAAPPAALAPGTPPPPPSTTPAPSLSPVAERAGVPPISKSEFLPTFDQLSFTIPIMVLAAALAAVLIILVAFPADIFNKTYENCREEIHRFLHLRHLSKLLSVPPWVQGVVLAAAAVSLGLLLSSDEGPAGGDKGNIIAQTIALAVAAPLVMAAYATPGELHLRRFRKAVMTVPLPALVFAVLCGLLSHGLKLEPGYTFGLFAMFFMLRGQKHPPEANKGRAVLFSALCLAALVAAGYAGFTVISPAAHSGAAGWAAVVFDAICYWLVVLGAESLIFALLPMRFLDGRTLAGWSLWLWTILQFGAGWFFWMVLQLKVHANADKFDADKITGNAELRAVLFFVVFGTLSLAFWGYFQWPGRPTWKPGDSHSPPLSELFRPRVAARRYRDEVVLAGRGLARGWRWCADWRRRSAPLRRRVRGLLWAPLQEPATRAAYYFFSFVARVSQSVSEAASHAAARTRPE
uniref:FGLLP motif-containing membrane protein n=1 Tax=Paractinoplanes polyasparticus TaxID=2856853 RepID=UPI001C865964|nr:FGLLP motif-containing membrane protein [Actinoplanes polyasparticus]